MINLEWLGIIAGLLIAMLYCLSERQKDKEIMNNAKVQEEDNPTHKV